MRSSGHTTWTSPLAVYLRQKILFSLDLSASSLLPMEITGSSWRRFLSVVTKLLGPQALERSRRVRGDELDRFYNNLFDKAVKKESVEICEEALKLTINSICKLIMGRCCLEEGGVAERVKRLANELDVMTRKILLANMLPPWLKKLVLSLFKKEVMVVSNRFNELIYRFQVS